MYIFHLSPILPRLRLNFTTNSVFASFFRHTHTHIKRTSFSFSPNKTIIPKLLFLHIYSEFYLTHISNPTRPSIDILVFVTSIFSSPASFIQRSTHSIPYIIAGPVVLLINAFIPTDIMYYESVKIFVLNTLQNIFYQSMLISNEK